MPRLKYKLASPLIMWAIVALGGLLLWLIVPAGRLFTSGVYGVVIFILALINWVYVSIAAYRAHPKRAANVRNINQLVTEGAYSVVRHPLYVSDIILALSVFILEPTYKILAVAAWLTVVLLFWANWEERLLEEKFLADYAEYKRKVPMLIPRLGGHKT